MMSRLVAFSAVSLISSFLSVVALAFNIGSASAQSASEFVGAFSGDWQVYDLALSLGKDPCRLVLSGISSDPNRMTLSTSGCAAPLASATAWSIEGAQLVLYDGDDRQIVRLGGNQRRINGSTESNQPIMLERPGGDGSAARLQAAYNASGCYYMGYSEGCAPRTELALPKPGPDGRIRVLLTTNLLAYGEPRAESDVIGTVQEKTCVVVDTCIMASDGPWCRAQFDNVTGWLRKLTLRQNRWPVVTYANSCAP